MESFNDIDHNNQTKRSIIKTIDHQQHRASLFNRECIICGSKAIGMNFGAPTCAPCKAFFRRNARRKEILESPCHHPEKITSKDKTIELNEKTIQYLQIRRCTSCRLRRCFDIGMKQELIRTEEENQRHKQLVNTNRKRREFVKQQQGQLAIPQSIVNSSDLLNQIDWRHLSNIVSAYDTHCLKTYVEERGKMLVDELRLEKKRTIKDYAILPISVTLSLSTFTRSLPAFQTLSRNVQNFLCQSNIRRLIFINLHELNQSCFSEPWQISFYRTGWEFICGSELFQQFCYIEDLAEKLIIADPIVTRLWLVVLFFSTPLFSFYDSKSSSTMKKRIPCINIQNAYVTLLWKYLLFRHGYMESIRIYSNLIQVYLHMLRVGIEINLRFRAQLDLIETQNILEKIVTLDTNNT